MKYEVSDCKKIGLGFEAKDIISAKQDANEWPKSDFSISIYLKKNHNMPKK